MSEALPGETGDEQKLGLPPVACELTRAAVRDSDIRIKRTTHFLNEGDEGYDIQQESLSGELTSAQNAFEARPEGCEMQCGGDDNYCCARCEFQADMNPLQL